MPKWCSSEPAGANSGTPSKHSSRSALQTSSSSSLRGAASTTLTTSSKYSQGDPQSELPVSESSESDSRMSSAMWAYMKTVKRLVSREELSPTCDEERPGVESSNKSLEPFRKHLSGVKLLHLLRSKMIEPNLCCSQQSLDVLGDLHPDFPGVDMQALTPYTPTSEIECSLCRGSLPLTPTRSTDRLPERSFCIHSNSTLTICPPPILGRDQAQAARNYAQQKENAIGCNTAAILEVSPVPLPASLDQDGSKHGNLTNVGVPCAGECCIGFEHSDEHSGFAICSTRKYCTQHPGVKGRSASMLEVPERSVQDHEGNQRSPDRADGHEREDSCSLDGVGVVWVTDESSSEDTDSQCDNSRFEC